MRVSFWLDDVQEKGKRSPEQMVLTLENQMLERKGSYQEHQQGDHYLSVGIHLVLYI